MAAVTVLKKPLMSAVVPVLQNTLKSQAVSIADVVRRVEALEVALARSKPDLLVVDGDCPFSATAPPVDLAPLAAALTTDTVLRAVYINEDDEDADKCYLSRLRMPLAAVGIIGKARAPFVYLGGPGGTNERRRSATIPLFVAHEVPVFNPQSQTGERPTALLAQHLQQCTAAVFDFTGDLACPEYFSAVDIGFLVFQERVDKFFVVNAPTLLQLAYAPAEDVPISNIYGPWCACSGRLRRAEYHKIIELLTGACPSSLPRVFPGSKGMDDFLAKLTLDDPSLLTVDRRTWITGWKTDQLIDLYQQLLQADFQSDVAHILRVAFGVAIVRSVVALHRETRLENIPGWTLLEGEMRTIVDLGVLYTRSYEVAQETETVITPIHSHWHAVTELIDYIDAIFTPAAAEVKK